MNEYDRVKKSIRKPWLSLYMDGRNEHGTHLLPCVPDGVGVCLDGVSNMLHCQEPDVERIFARAESLGFADGHVIVATVDVEEPDKQLSIYRLDDVDYDLTCLMHGSPEEQAEDLEALVAAEA